jgi:hypothetical protein
MAKSLHIIKVGKNNTVRNVIDEDSFKRFYEPNGWVIDTSFPMEVTDYEIKTTDETMIKNLESAKKKGVEKQFDDKIIKGR